MNVRRNCVPKNFVRVYPPQETYAPRLVGRSKGSQFGSVAGDGDGQPLQGQCFGGREEGAETLGFIDPS